MSKLEHSIRSSTFEAASFRFAVEARRDVVNIAEHLFEDLRSKDDCSKPISIFELRQDEPDEQMRWTVSGPNSAASRSDSLTGAFERLVTAITRSALDSDPTRLHLHAAAISTSEQAVILCGPSGAGKTTLASRLALEGWSYITDEMVTIGRFDEHISGLAKPVSIKSSGRHLVASLANSFVDPSDEPNRTCHVPIGPAGLRVARAAGPKVIVWMPSREHSDSANPVPRVAHPADATVSLMSQTMDAERFGEDAIVELARLANRCLCYEIATAELTAMVELVADAVNNAGPVDRPEIRVLGAGDGDLKPSTRSVVIGDRIVIHNLADGRVLALDPMGSQVWLALAGWTSDVSADDLASPVVLEFVSQLVGLGLVDRSIPIDEG